MEKRKCRGCKSLVNEMHAVAGKYADGCAFFCFSQREYRFKQSVETTNPNVSPALSKKFGLQSLGGEGETRTLAPVTRPTPLAGAPRHQLEYFSMAALCFLYQIVLQLISMAERVGFEPTVPVRVRRFSRPFRYDHFGISP